MSPKARWAIRSVKHNVRLDGTAAEFATYFEKQFVFNVFTSELARAQTWPTKQGAVGYMRRVLGRRPGQDGYDVVNLATLEIGAEGASGGEQ